MMGDCMGPVLECPQSCFDSSACQHSFMRDMTHAKHMSTVVKVMTMFGKVSLIRFTSIDPKKFQQDVFALIPALVEAFVIDCDPIN